MHPEKYLGSETPVFKSGLELKFMRYADLCPVVVNWAYETKTIQYMDMSSKPPKMRTYFIDFVIWCRTKTGTKKIWVEIKNSKETELPKNPSTRDKLLFLKNKSKWDAATKLAAQNGCAFKIITEKQLS